LKLILLGPPGAGKGTQAELFRLRDGLPHVSTGDILRQAVRDGTEVGWQAFGFMHAGDLVPDQVVDRIVQIRLAEPDCADGFILDGYPRTIGQADALETWLAREDRGVDAVVFFEIREEVLLRRLTGRRVCPTCGAIYHIDHKPPKVAGRCDLDGSELIQRKDDTLSTALHRLEVFGRWTGPLVEHYRKRGVFLGVNAERPELEVYQSIREFAEARTVRRR
jgi:adenylate kinase